MSKVHTQPAKPRKPYPSFPLTPHNNGQWCKKVRGTVHFFGVWADPTAALDRYHCIAAELHAGGRVPMRTLASTAPTVKQVGNEFLAYQQERVAGGQIGGRWFEDCRRVVLHFAKQVGKYHLASELALIDFQRYRTTLATQGLTGSQGLGVHALTRALTVVKAMFIWASETGLIDQHPRWGKALNKPSAAEHRTSRTKSDAANGLRLLDASQVQALLRAAVPQLRAAILLGINGGFGNTDCGCLPHKAVDLDRAVVDFDRPKTAVRRMVPLWPETAAALHVVMQGARPDPIDDSADHLVFLTETGRPLVREQRKLARNGDFGRIIYIDRLGVWFGALLKSLGMKRPGIGFYTLRHTFRTWADEVRDQHAIHRIMGHAIPGMSGLYVEEISLDRLRAVVDHVRAKLFESSD